MRVVLAWLVGVGVFSLVGLFLREGGDAIGVVSISGVIYGTNGDLENALSLYGLCSLVLALSLGIWAYGVARTGRWNGDELREGDVGGMRAAIFCTAVMVVVTAITQLVFRQFQSDWLQYFRIAIDLTAGLGVYWCYKNLDKNRHQNIRFRDES